MSRIGKRPIPLPKGVTLLVEAGNSVTVKGPNGQLSQTLPDAMIIAQEEGQIFVRRPDETKRSRSLHGLTRTLLANMIIGVTDGFKKVLEINGVGYRAAVQGKILNLSLGFSHPVVLDPPAGITFAVGEKNSVIISGPDKQLVGDIAAKIRELRPPEPYLGKGIKYQNEVIRRKAGKAGKTGKGAKK
jgi:large subunit ribosomal protein L6